MILEYINMHPTEKPYDESAIPGRSIMQRFWISDIITESIKDGDAIKDIFRYGVITQVSFTKIASYKIINTMYYDDVNEYLKAIFTQDPGKCIKNIIFNGAYEIQSICEIPQYGGYDGYEMPIFHSNSKSTLTQFTKTYNSGCDCSLIHKTNCPKGTGKSRCKRCNQKLYHEDYCPNKRLRKPILDCRCIYNIPKYCIEKHTAGMYKMCKCIWKYDHDCDGNYKIKETKICECKIRHSNRCDGINKVKEEKITMFDISNWMPYNIGELADMNNIKYYENDTNNYEVKNMQNVLINRITILINTIAEIKEWGGPLGCFNIGWTVGSNSLKYFRKWDVLYKLKGHQKMNRLITEFEAYHGGRQVVNKLGKLPKQRYYKLDCNALYPFMMKSYKVSSKFVGLKNNLKEVRKKLLSGKYNILINCDVECDIPKYPCKTNNGIFYPIGKFNTTLCGTQALQEVMNNNIKRFNYILMYENTDILKKPINYLWKMKGIYKNNGEIVKEKYTKLIMNSIYGKFAQLGTEMVPLNEKSDTCYGITNVWNAKTQDIDLIYTINYQKYIELRHNITEHTFPIISAEISANAKYYMQRFFNIAGWDHVYYSNTDSIITDEIGYKRLKKYINPDKMGMLKVESVSENVRIFGKNNIIFGEDKMLSGIPKSAIEKDNNTFEFTKRNSLKNEIFHNSTPASIRTQFTYNLLEKDPSQFWNSNGDAIPWSFTSTKEWFIPKNSFIKTIQKILFKK